MTSNPDESDLVLAISPDNRMMHVGPACELLDHVLRAREDPSAPLGLELYDVTGRRRSIHSLHTQWCSAPDEPEEPEALGVRVDQLEVDEGEVDELELDQLEADQGEVDEREADGREVADRRRPRQRVLLRRIRESLDLGQSVLSAHPELGNQGPNVPPATEVPRPEGSYPEVLERLAFEFSPLAPGNRGNWLHNLYHAATGTS
jgi:hypothetical protein